MHKQLFEKKNSVRKELLKIASLKTQLHGALLLSWNSIGIERTRYSIAQCRFLCIL